MSEFTPPPSDFDPNDPHLIVAEEKKPTFVDRYGAAFALLVLGMLLFLVAFGILFWNENKTVIETLRLSEGSRLVVPLLSDVPDSDNNGQLVHVTGKTDTKDILADELFYMSANAMKMQRIVEMYQWQEVPDPNAGSQGAVNYEKVWSARPINSSKFKQVQGHNNPPMELESNEYIAQNVTLGGFILSEGFILQMAGYEDYPLTQEDYAKINPELVQFKYYKNGFYRGANPEAPEVGDVRVRYRVLYPGKEVSVIGMQNLDRLETFHTDYSSIKMLTEGKVDADTMLRREVKARDMSMIWWLRFGGWIGMLASVWMTLYSFTVLSRVFPLIGGMVGYNNFELSFFISLAFTLLTVAFAWFSFQPAFGLGLMVVSCSLIISTAFLQKAGEKEARKLQRRGEKEERKLRAKQPRPRKQKKRKGEDEEPAEDLMDTLQDMPVEAGQEAEPGKPLPAKLKFMKAPKKD